MSAMPVTDEFPDKHVRGKLPSHSCFAVEVDTKMSTDEKLVHNVDHILVTSVI